MAVSNWLRWLFRRGSRGTMLLIMEPGDEIAGMTPWRGWLAVVSRRGKLYLVAADNFDRPYVDVAPDVIWQKQT